MTIHLEATVESIVEDEQQIAAMLKELNPPALIMSIVHMSGDASVLTRWPSPKIIDVVEASSQSVELLEGGYTKEQGESICEHALEVIRDYRANDCKMPHLSEEVMDQLLDFMCGHHLDDEYRAFIREEIALDGIDQRGLRFDSEAGRQRATQFPVVIIGAGMGGVLAAIRLRQAGMPFTVIEKNPAVGGTWFENHYPGCRVDVPGHSYSYSFEPNHDWECYYPLAEDIRAYFDGCADRYGVKSHIRFNSEVVQASFDDNSQRWQVQIKDADGQVETLEACAVISAVGQLNRPKLPDIPGRDSFSGPLFHSGAWPDGVSLDGKRVAVIGSGASAFQIIPEVANAATSLKVFQRSPVWMFPNPTYHDRVSSAKRWALKKLPYYSKWYRFWLFYVSIEGVYDKTLVDENWHSENSVSQSNDDMRKLLSAWINSQVSDPDLLEKVLPDYPPFGKRILQDNGTYLQALQRDNVEVLTQGIERIEARGLVTTDGSLHEVDVIVCATGFHADRFLFPMRVIGRQGIELSDQWGQNNGRAYLGITVPNFPNLFCIYGPNTNLVVAGSIAHNAESQVNYILRSIKLLLENDYAAIECRQDIHDQYNERVDEVNAGTAWGSPAVTNWYKNDQGRVIANLPFRIIDYWRMTKDPNPEDYHFS